MERSDASSVSAAASSVDFAADMVWNPLMELPFHVASSNPLWKKPTWRESRFLVILLLICSDKAGEGGGSA